MRHVSRTHKVALDWFFDRINLDPQIHIKYVDTKNQLADILTKSNFARDGWNHLLRLLNISNFSSINCPQRMLKRTQEETGEERIVAKSKPALNLVSEIVASSSTAQSSSESNCPGILKAPSQSLSLVACAGKPAAEDSNPKDAASSPQVWQSDVKPNVSAERPAATETNKNLDLLARAEKPAAKGSNIVDVDSECPNDFQISGAYVPHLEKVYSNLRQTIGHKPGDEMEDFDVNSLIW